MTYYQFSDPALNTFVKAEADKWMRKDWVQFLGTRSVPVQKLSTILAEAEPHSPIDLLTIDAEGLSLDVLSSLAWSTSAHYPHVIVIEGDAESFLEAKGYKLYQICGLSKVFVRKE